MSSNLGKCLVLPYFISMCSTFISLTWTNDIGLWFAFCHFRFLPRVHKWSTLVCKYIIYRQIRERATWSLGRLEPFVRTCELNEAHVQTGIVNSLYWNDSVQTEEKLPSEPTKSLSFLKHVALKMCIQRLSTSCNLKKQEESLLCPSFRDVFLCLPVGEQPRGSLHTSFFLCFSSSSSECRMVGQWGSFSCCHDFLSFWTVVFVYILALFVPMSPISLTGQLSWSWVQTIAHPCLDIIKTPWLSS